MTTNRRSCSDLAARADESRMIADAYARAYAAGANGPDASYMRRTQALYPDVAADQYELPTTTREPVLRRAIALTVVL